MRKAHFPIRAPFTHANKLEPAMATIEEVGDETFLLHVRIRGQRKVYTVDFNQVAVNVVQGVQRAEVAEGRTRRRRNVSRGMLTTGR